MLQQIKKEAREIINQELNFDNDVSYKGVIIYKKKIFVAANFSYDYIDINKNLRCIFHMEYLHNFLQQQITLEVDELFVLPIITGSEDNAYCQLILIEAKNINNKVIGYANILGGEYIINKKLFKIFKNLNIEVISINKLPNNLHSAIVYIKEQYLCRLNSFCQFTKEEKHYIRNVFPEINTNLNLIFCTESFNSALNVLKNREALVEEIRKKLINSQWYDAQNIINCYLMRKLHVGVTRYFNESGFFLYNDNVFRKLEELGKSKGNPYVYFSMYSWLEYNIIKVLNEYIIQKGDIISSVRRANLSALYQISTSQEYIKPILNMTSSVSEFVNINTLLESIKFIAESNILKQDYLDFGIGKIKINSSLLGNMLIEKLTLITDGIRTIWGRFSIVRFSGDVSAEQSIANWKLTSLPNKILFVEYHSSEWQAYRKVNDFEICMANISSKSATSNVLGSIVTTSKKCLLNDLTVSQIHQLLNTLYFEYSSNKGICLFNQISIKDTKLKKHINNKIKNNYEIQDTKLITSSAAFFSNSKKNSDLNNDSLNDFRESIIVEVGLEFNKKLDKLNDEIILLQNEINNLKTENRKLNNENQKWEKLNNNSLKSLKVSNKKLNEKIIKTLYLYDCLLIRYEELYSIANKQVYTGVEFDLKKMIYELTRILEDKDLQETKENIMNIFTNEILFVCYCNDQDFESNSNHPIVLISENRISIYGVINESHRYQVKNLSNNLEKEILKILLTDKNWLEIAKTSPRANIEIADPIIRLQLLDFLKVNNFHNYQLETENVLIKQAHIIERCKKLILQYEQINNCKPDRVSESNKISTLSYTK